jgi:hypothetical protein
MKDSLTYFVYIENPDGTDTIRRADYPVENISSITEEEIKAYACRSADFYVPSELAIEGYKIQKVELVQVMQAFSAFRIEARVWEVEKKERS